MKSLHNQLGLAGGTAHTTPILLIASTQSPFSCWAAILQPLGQECAGPTAPSGSVHLALSPPQDIPCRSLFGWLLLLFQVSTQLSPLWEASLTSLCLSLPLPSIALLRFIFFIQLAMIWHYSDPLTYLSSTCPTADQLPEHKGLLHVSQQAPLPRTAPGPLRSTHWTGKAARMVRIQDKLQGGRAENMHPSLGTEKDLKKVSSELALTWARKVQSYSG